MTPEQHAAKAKRIIAAMSKLTASDYEMVIEAAMLAGSQWFNAALHRLGLTAFHDDVMHAEYLSTAMRVKVSLMAPGLVEELEQIEQCRARYVRGNAERGEVVAKACVERLRRLEEIVGTACPVPGLAVYEISTRGVSHGRD
jgi:hypothetical protein